MNEALCMIGGPCGRTGDWLQRDPDSHFAGLQLCPVWVVATENLAFSDRAQFPLWACCGGPWPFLVGSAFLKVLNAFGCRGKGRMTFALLSRLCHLLFTRVTPPLPSVGWVGAGAVRQPRYGNTLLSEVLPRELCHRHGDTATQWLGGHALRPGPLLTPAGGWFSFWLVNCRALTACLVPCQAQEQRSGKARRFLCS